MGDIQSLELTTLLGSPTSFLSSGLSSTPGTLRTRGLSLRTFKKAAQYSELEEGQIRGVTIDGDSIALYRIDSQVFATTDTCSHQKCSLEEFGTILGEEVECMCHLSRFNIKTGEATSLPAVKPLRVYKVKVEGENVLIEL